MNHLTQQTNQLQRNGSLSDGRFEIEPALMEQATNERRSEKVFSDETRQKYIKRARKGGEARARRYEPIKSAITDVIADRTPQSGWLSYIGAARIILNDLEEHHAQVVVTSGLKYENLLDTIVRWLKNDTAKRFKFRLKNQLAPESKMS